MRWRWRSDRTGRLALLASAIALLAPTETIRGQGEYNPLPEGFRFAVQAGIAWSTLADVEPLGDQRFGRQRGFPTSLRMSRNLAGPLVGFLEAGTAERGAKVSVPTTPDTEYRTSWWQAVGGVSVVGRCISFFCPALDAGVGFARNRQSVLYSEETGRPVGTVGVARYETSAVAGVRVTIPRLREVALVLRHQEGLTNLPTNGSKARSRGQQVLITLPLIR